MTETRKRLRQSRIEAALLSSSLMREDEPGLPDVRRRRRLVRAREVA